jgi:addiction module HigA family antidote
LKRETHPTTPGEILIEEFLEPLGITQRDFAKAISVTPSYLSDIVHGRRGVSADMALRFEMALKMPARFWLNAQLACDLYEAEQDGKANTKRCKIQLLNTAA